MSAPLEPCELNTRLRDQCEADTPERRTSEADDWSDDPQPMPEVVQAKFDAMPPSIREPFSPTRGIKDVREYCKDRIRALRKQGLEVDEMVAIARAYPAQFGKLRAQTWPVFAAIIGELKAEDAENARKADELAKTVLAPILWVYRDPATIPPREWLIGTTLLRGYATLLASTGGVGKTAYVIALALAYITGRRDILDEHVFQTGNAWIITLEDDRIELERRIAAAMIAHGISHRAIEGRLFINSSASDKRPLLLAKADETGTFVVCDDTDRLKKGIEANGIGLTIIDPLVKSHKAIENNNAHMDQLSEVSNGIARETGSALLLAAHNRKGGGEDGARDAIRGGAALVDGERITKTLMPMSQMEAAAFKIAPDQASRLIRLTDAKSNMAPKQLAKWLELVSIPLGNCTAIYKAGDNVQAVKAWKPPALFDGIELPVIQRIFARLRGAALDKRGAPDLGWFYSLEPRQKYWAGGVIMEMAGKNKADAATVLRIWKTNGVLSTAEYTTPQRHLGTKVMLNEAKIAEMLAPIWTMDPGDE